MAEAIVMIGLVSSIVSFVQVGGQVLAQIRELHGGVGKMSEVLLDIEEQLPLMIQNLNRIKEGGDDGIVLLRTVQKCEKQIKQLAKIIEHLRPTSKDSSLEHCCKGIAKVGKEEKLAKILHNLRNHESALTLYFAMKPGSSRVAPTETEGTYYEIAPVVVSQFVERKELLQEIDESFSDTAASASLKVVVLLGMGGQGKTQIALRYCQEVRSSGKFMAIFWIDASSRITLVRGFESIATKLSNAGRVFDDLDSKITFVKETLGKRLTPWLLVFDNYDQPTELSDITRFFPQGKTGAILFTSRHADSERLGNTIKVMQMTDQESLELLLRRSTVESTDDNVMEGRKIVQKLGNLPLAVDQAGAYISARRIPLPEFLRHYDDRKEVILKHTPSLWEYHRQLGKDEEETALSVFTTWELSFQQIGQNDKDRAMIGHFLTLCAFLDVSNVFEGLFKSQLSSLDNCSQTMQGILFAGVWDEYKCCISVPTRFWWMKWCAAKSIVPTAQWIECFVSKGEWDRYKYEDVVTRLRGLSLLQTMDREGLDIIFSLHPLVRDWLRLREDHKSREEYTMQAMRMVTRFIMMHDQGRPPMSAKLDILPHVDVCVENDKEFLRNINDVNQKFLPSFLFAFGFMYHLRYRHVDGERLFLQALEGYESMLGPKNMLTINTITRLGGLYLEWGKSEEAHEMYGKAVRQIDKVFGESHPRMLWAMDNLGLVYRDQGKFIEAEKVHEKTLAGREKSLGPSHPSTLDTMHNLGIVYLKQMRLEEAEEIFERALKGNEDVFGIDHPNTLRIMDNLGLVYRNQGKFDEAEKMHKRDLVGRENTLGLDHPSTLTTVHNLGIVYLEQMRLEAAEEMLKRALKGNEEVFGSGHPSTLSTMGHLGLVYCHQGKFDQAEDLHKRALLGKEKALGLYHPDTLSTVHNLGIVYLEQKRLEEAEEIFERALKGREKVFGTNHPYTWSTMDNLGLLYSDQGKLEEAKEIHMKTLVERENSLGSSHPNTLATIHNLGIVYLKQMRLEDAKSMLERALIGNEIAFGTDHPSTLSTMDSLGLVYRHQGKFDEAEKVHKHDLDGREKLLGPDHPSTLATMHNLGVVYLEQMRLDEAEDMLERALKGRQKVFRIDHPSTLSTMDNLALIYGIHGKLDETEQMCKLILEARERLLGLDDPSTLHIVHNLGVVYLKQMRLEKAKEMFERALEGKEQIFGMDHPSTLNTMDSLRLVYSEEVELDKA